MKRSELKRSSAPLKRSSTPLKRSELKATAIDPKPGKKAKRDARELSASRLAVLERSQARCEAGYAGCTIVATMLHHRQPRRTADNRPVNLLHLCAGCHQHGHQRSDRYQTGFMVRANGKLRPEEVPFIGPSGRVRPEEVPFIGPSGRVLR